MALGPPASCQHSLIAGHAALTDGAVLDLLQAALRKICTSDQVDEWYTTLTSVSEVDATALQAEEAAFQGLVDRIANIYDANDLVRLDESCFSW